MLGRLSKIPRLAQAFPQAFQTNPSWPCVKACPLQSLGDVRQRHRAHFRSPKTLLPALKEVLRLALGEVLWWALGVSPDKPWNGCN